MLSLCLGLQNPTAPTAMCDLLRYHQIWEAVLPFSVSTSNPRDASLWYLSVSWVQKSESSIWCSFSFSTFKNAGSTAWCPLCSNIIKIGVPSRHVFSASTSKFRDPMPMFSLLGILYKREYELSMLYVCQVVFSLPPLQYTQVWAHALSVQNPP